MTLRYGLPHGIACSFTLPLVLDMAWGETPDRDAALQKVFNADRKTAVERLRNFLHQLDVVPNFRLRRLRAGSAGDGAERDAGARGKNFIGTKAIAALP